MRHYLLFILFLCSINLSIAQRSYHQHSVLSSGNWYKLSVNADGVYKIDVPFLQNLGLTTNNIASSQIRLFGNGGQMLPENNAAPRIDDLSEIAIRVIDGGDGIFNNQDYLLFYGTGPDKWSFDSTSNHFSHIKNLYSDRSFYFLTIGGIGKRIQPAATNLSPNVQVNSYTFRTFHELDTVNFLSSGKEWYGEEFSTLPGKINVLNFSTNINNAVIGSTVTLTSEVASRSAGAFSQFDVKANNNTVLQHNIAFTGNGPYDPFAVTDKRSSTFTPDQQSIALRYTYTPGNPTAQGWLNYFQLEGRGMLSMPGNDQLIFRDIASVQQANVATFNVQTSSMGVNVWQISDPQQPQSITVNNTASGISFTQPADKLQEYIAFSTVSYKTPVAIGAIANQDLHNSTQTDLLIVTDNLFIPEANRLAMHHQQHDNLKTVVVTTAQIFNEFSSGIPDPAAIRDFVKMYYDKAGSTIGSRPKYLLLFGDASFDYKNRISNNTNLLPCYESQNSLDPLASYSSDDFYGFLNDNEDINNPGVLNLLDIGVGRIPANNLSGAKAAVDKIIAYTSSAGFGSWRNEITIVADDEDNNLHFNDAESLSNIVRNISPDVNVEKIYLDAYRQESGSGGNRYPDGNNAINNKMLSGNLIWNYLGHGSYRRLADETILDAEIVNRFNNENKLPLFITATCDFTPYDNPVLPSLGENLLLRPKTGAIALLSSSRVVFANSNKNLNENFLTAISTPSVSGIYSSLGEALMKAKNFNYQNFPDILNNRKFTLIGDPALTIAFPVYKIKTLAVNNIPVSAVPDTLKPLGKYTITAMVTDLAGNVLNNFNGFAYPTIYDKPQLVRTLANDPSSVATVFSVEKNVVYKGKVPVVNGQFTYTFIVPKDVSPQAANGRISYYAENGEIDANGGSSNIKIGGNATGVNNDVSGPDIKAFLNDEKFINGSITNENPLLLIKLFDSSGINVTGAGIGHDITAVLDDDQRKTFELNAAYEAEIGTYQAGRVRFQLPVMENGVHHLKIKAWDVYNNSTEYLLEFRVVNSEDLQISHVLNYPNPFSAKTNFWFEHNLPGENLQVRVRIFTVSGKVVKTINQTINTIGNRSSEVSWNGRDDYGEKVGRGVYIYELTVQAKGKQTSVNQKLVIL